ncbi:NAD(P)-binding protein [Amycolatopsis jiangsuensis]|uniref:NAD(P)-binding protein n=1 Tax=Amycolatopsis jiangsuensis TaxID=1181879 RepID=UPI0028B03F80|nr:NAD(P)-binding protein [Amycolatopsis jiangsuensis]
MNEVEVAVVGGGTGGLCLAHGLRRAGVKVAVYERSRTRTERLQGYRVHIDPTGSSALHECLSPSTWDSFLVTTGTSAGGFAFVTEQLRELAMLSRPPDADPATAHHSASRISLHRVTESSGTTRNSSGTSPAETGRSCTSRTAPPRRPAWLSARTGRIHACASSCCRMPGLWIPESPASPGSPRSPPNPAGACRSG